MRQALSTFAVALALVAGPGPAPARAALPNETLRAYVKRAGARVDAARGNMIVTSTNAARGGAGRLEIRIVNDPAKQRLGFYAYGFGNAASAKDSAALYAYLLRANADLAIGAFFVDRDADVGYKFFLSTREQPSYATFETVYAAMVDVITTRGPEVVRLAGPPGKAAPAKEDEPETDGGAGAIGALGRPFGASRREDFR